MNETKCVKRDTWIPVGACDCNEFMMGWYHSTIRSRAMKQYELEYWREATEPFAFVTKGRTEDE